MTWEPNISSQVGCHSNHCSGRATRRPRLMLGCHGDHWTWCQTWRPRQLFGCHSDYWRWRVTRTLLFQAGCHSDHWRWRLTRTLLTQAGCHSDHWRWRVTRTLLSQAGCHSDHCGDVAPVRMCAGRRLHTVSYGLRVQFGICLSVHGDDRNVLTVLPAVQPSASINGDTDL